MYSCSSIYIVILVVSICYHWHQKAFFGQERFGTQFWAVNQIVNTSKKNIRLWMKPGVRFWAKLLNYIASRTLQSCAISLDIWGSKRSTIYDDATAVYQYSSDTLKKYQPAEIFDRFSSSSAIFIAVKIEWWFSTSGKNTHFIITVL